MKSVAGERPLGVWCLDVDGCRVVAAEWTPTMKMQGVLVVTGETAFVVSPHMGVGLQWGAMDQVRSELVRDTESLDSKAATDAMIVAYDGMHYEHPRGRIWDVDGAPAAEWCRRYEHGNIGAGGWDLPTVAQLRLINVHRDAINRCLAAMGGSKVTPDWYWSSNEEYDLLGAWIVGMGNGAKNDHFKYDSNLVRPVSIFPI